MQKPLALFLAGTNGSGKSTFRDFLHKDKFEDLLIIDPDKFTKENGDDNRQGGRNAIVVFNECIKNKMPFCMETTLSGKSVLNRILLAKNSGFSVIMLYFGLNSAKLNVDRVAYRVSQGGHDIPTNLIIKRYDESRKNLLKALNLLDKLEIYDNSDKMQLQVIMEGDNLTYKSEILSPWIKKILKEMR